MIGQIISHYKILEELGRGGMGVVYRAKDTRLDRFVAIKFLSHDLSGDESAKKRFTREAKAASALEHPNICSIYEIDEAPDGRLFTVMPCYEGETLRGRLDDGPLEIDEALEVASRVASGLAGAHEKGIIHRDIKPGNVMLTDDGNQSILMDFGLAKKLDATKVTRTGMTVGTIAYMSPEQALGKETDQRTDIWSLGVMLYEMLAGRLPFRGDVEPALLYSLINEEPEPVTATRREVPLQVEMIIEKALSKDVEKRYQGMDELLGDLEEQRDKWALGIKERRFVKIRRKTRRKILRVLVPTAVVAVIALAIFVYQKIKPIPPEAIARENSMAIMYFENMADPEDTTKIAETITHLLTTGLGDSDYIKVIGRQRVYDILKQMEKAEQKVVDRTTASEVAKRAGVNWAMTGTVIQTEPNLVVSADIWHCVTGEVRMGVRKRFEAGEDIFAAVDTLIGEITKELSLPREAMDELGRSVTGITTHSEEAYRHYIEGLESFWNWDWDKAAKSQRKALEFDSTFAMAYLELARDVWLLNLDDKTPELQSAIAKAVQYSDKVSQKDKLYIDAWDRSFSGRHRDAIAAFQKITTLDPDEKEAWYQIGEQYRIYLGQFEDAILQYRRVLELDPDHLYAYNMISVCYAITSDFENATWAANQLVSRRPDLSWGYDILGWLNAMTGELDRAIELYEKCLLMEEGELWENYMQAALGRLYLFKRDYARSNEAFGNVATSDDPLNRVAGRRYLAYVPAYQGRLAETLRLLDDIITADESDENQDEGKYVLRALVNMERGNLEPALEDIQRAIRIRETGGPRAMFEFDLVVSGFIADRLMWRAVQIYLLAQGGKIDEAEQVVRALESEAADREALTESYWWARGVLELSKGNTSAAVARLERALEEVQSEGFLPIEKDAYIRFFLAKAYLESGNPTDAAAELEKLLRAYDTDRMIFGLWTVRAHYLLGMAYEELGRSDDAIAQYQEFLEIWKDADPALSEVPDARQRLARLESSG